MLATIPHELLLMLRPYLSLSSINALSQTSKFFRDLFDEAFLEVACHRRKLSRPLAEQGKENVKERIPNYRTLVASMCAHLKTCKVKKCHAFLKFPVGDEEVKPFLTPEMTFQPGVKIAVHKLLNKLQMVYYHDWTEASMYLEKGDFYATKKSATQESVGKDDGEIPEVRIIDHLPLAAFQCSAPALYADEYGGFGWPIENEEGVTLLDCVQALTMGIGYVMKENWKRMQIDAQWEEMMDHFEGDDGDLDMLIHDLAEKLDKEWEKNEDMLRLGVADEFMGDSKYFNDRSCDSVRRPVPDLFCTFLCSKGQGRIEVWRAL